MIARPPPSYEWTLHPGLTDYGAVCTLFGHTYAVFAVGLATLIFRIQPPFFFQTERAQIVLSSGMSDTEGGKSNAVDQNMRSAHA